MPSAMTVESVGLLELKLPRLQEPRVASARGRRAARAPAPRRSRAAARPRSTRTGRMPSPGTTCEVADRLPELLALDPPFGPDAHARHHLEEADAASGSGRPPSASGSSRVSAAAATRKAADDGIAGHDGRRTPRAGTCVTETHVARRRPARRGRAARARCGRGSGPDSRTVVRPSAATPARSTALLTCALGVAGAIVGSRAAARRARRRGRDRPTVSTTAPIARSGSATRSIGRAARLSSPARRASNGAAASTPVSRRIVVPEFPQRNGPWGSTSPARPSPSTSRPSATRYGDPQPRATRSTWNR